jgi:chromosome segregation protein
VALKNLSDCNRYGNRKLADISTRLAGIGDSIAENRSDVIATQRTELPANPFSGGLNLVAHPKGKPVQQLSSMSGARNPSPR